MQYNRFERAIHLRSCLASNARLSTNISCLNARSPNDRFLQNARLSGALLTLCELIFGCAEKNYLSGYSRRTCVFSNLLELFGHFPKTFGLTAFPKMKADLYFDIPKTTFLTIWKQQTTNFSYHESLKWLRLSEQIIYRNDPLGALVNEDLWL